MPTKTFWIGATKVIFSNGTKGTLTFNAPTVLPFFPIAIALRFNSPESSAFTVTFATPVVSLLLGSATIAFLCPRIINVVFT